MTNKTLISATVLIAAVVALGLVGCSAGDLLIAYTGGGLPPGEPDLGGIVVTQISSTTAQNPPGPPAGSQAVMGAHVRLLRGNSVLSQTMTGNGGYFRFQAPPTGTYTVQVVGPVGAGFEDASSTINHRGGEQTFITITLERSPGPGPGTGSP